MTMPTLDAIVDAVALVLGTATGLVKTERYDQLSEKVNETPLLQVYPNAGEEDADTLSTYVYVMESFTIHADLHARQRSNLKDDMKAVVTMTEAMLTVIRAEWAAKTNFSLAGIKRWEWSWERFKSEDYNTLGTRFIIKVWCYP